MAKSYAWVGLVFAMALAALGCDKGEGATCYEKSECGEGLACLGDDVRRCEKCDGQESCAQHGKCTAKEGLCVASSDEDCKKSTNCKANGPCTAKDGACVVGGDADCKQSQACAREKYCVAKGNNCIMSAADKKALADAKAKKKADAKKKAEAEAKKAEEKK
jgi:hypothetical protein